MNKERVSKYIEIWLANLEKENIDELEQEIEMPLQELLLEGIENLYKKYSDDISFIPIERDTYSDYIISPKYNKYLLEDFLINRLLRSVLSITYRDESNSFMQSSEYDNELGKVLIDKDRLKNQLNNVEQKRKLVLHEIFHGIKTQFTNGPFYNSDKYYQLKEQFKKIFGTEINDFDKKDNPENQINYNYIHSGLTYPSIIRKRNPLLYEQTNLDEGLNEVDAINCSNDTYYETGKLEENTLMILKNPESSNMAITNYAFIIEKLVDKQTLFVGLYLEPQEFYNSFNFLYTTIFQEHFNSNLSAIEIFSNQLARIKENPNNIEEHTKLLNTLYDCFNKKYIISGYNDDMRQKDIKFLASKGLLEIVDGKPQPLGTLAYCDEYVANSNKSKK